MVAMKVIGLMSGTSADGIDAALLEISPGKALPKIKLMQFLVLPFHAQLRERILRVADAGSGATSEICRLNVLLGELFAKAAISLARRAGVPLRDVALIGSHGQTIAHLPDPTVEHSVSIRSTLQIGEPSIISERTGITTVADFRPRDMAAGGEGAPLTPYLHALLFRHLRRDRIVLNLGGIANLTFLPKGYGLRGALAFDTGPGNVLIDGLVARLTGGTMGVDLDGRIAASGDVDPRLLRWLMTHPYFRRKPPKSTGREEFGPTLIDALLRRAAARGITEEDLVATVTAFTAESVALHVQRDLSRSAASSELITCGGGAKNPMLIRRFRRHCLKAVSFPPMTRAFQGGPSRLQPSHCSPISPPTAYQGIYPALPGRRIPPSLARLSRDGHFGGYDEKSSILRSRYSIA